MSNRYFLYDPAGDGFQTFPTAELRDAAAKAAIGDCLEDDGWLEDVFNITVGEITGTAVKTNIQQRPAHLDENGEDEEGDYWDADTEEKHDVEIRPLLPRRAAVFAALDALQAKFDLMMFNERHSTPFEALQKAQAELRSTIAVLRFTSTRAVTPEEHERQQMEARKQWILAGGDSLVTPLTRLELEEAGKEEA